MILKRIYLSRIMIKRLGQAQRQHERRVSPVHDAVEREPNVFRSSDLEIRVNRST